MLRTMAGKGRNALLVLIAAMSLTAGAVVAASAAPVSSHHGRVYLQTFSDVLLFKPRTFLLSGDDTLVAKRLHWRTWGGRTAVGTGIAGFNYCRPDCAAGRFHFFAARLTLSGRTGCRRVRHTIYTVTRLALLGSRRPRYYAATQILTAPCHGARTLK